MSSSKEWSHWDGSFNEGAVFSRYSIWFCLRNKGKMITNCYLEVWNISWYCRDSFIIYLYNTWHAKSGKVLPLSNNIKTRRRVERLEIMLFAGLSNKEAFWKASRVVLICSTYILDNKLTTKPTCSVGPPSVRRWNAIWMAFHWRVDGEPLQ